VSRLLGRLVEDVEHFRRRVLESALCEGESRYWLRRADDFAKVGTPECDEVARACRHRAELSLIGGAWPEIDDVLSEAGEAS
jgi:hypothetical protein